MGGWQRIAAAFEAAYRRAPETVADAGGRVNLIGEHTDYHEGFVFPAAIDLRTRVAGAARPDGVLRVRSVNRGEETTVAIADLAPPSRVDWQAYVLGPFWALREAGHPIVGADIVVEGEVPFGGGLSSSASVEVALAALGGAMASVDLPPAELARLARVAENGFCRVPCGAMDQVASACGRTDHALLLDCRTLVATPVPMPEDWRIVVADSGVRHAVAGPEYARRQHECAEGLAVLRDLFPDVVAARDLTMEMLTDHRDRLSDVSFRRLRHVVTENARCLAAQAALSRGDGATMGRLMAGSHESLAADYEVSCRELDVLVDAAAGIPGCIGARLTGAGFGGNTVNLVHADAAEDFTVALAELYRARLGRDTTVRVVRAAAGVTAVRLQEPRR